MSSIVWRRRSSARPPVCRRAGWAAPTLEAVFVPHPIQDQTKDEIEARADAVIAEIVGKLTG